VERESTRALGSETAKVVEMSREEREKVERMNRVLAEVKEARRGQEKTSR
jgi:hypothetical protein